MNVIARQGRLDEPEVLLRLLEVPDMARVDWTGTWRLSCCGTELSACAPGVIRLDGLFDSFFDSYWSRFTALEGVSLQCRVYGHVIVSVLRRDVAHGGEACLATWDARADPLEQELGQGRDVEITVPLPDPGAPESRLIVQFTAGAEGAKVVAPRWTTRQEPVRRVHLGVVITTFNREHFMERNLRLLSGRLGSARLIVVNHGAPGLGARMEAAIRTDDDVRFIDQENSGGAGGFVRGMKEHFEARDITHVLLMDDDIDMPRDLVQRMEAVLAYADAQLCLGGAMFDFHERSRLFSAGDILLPGSFGVAHVAPDEGCDIRQAAGVDYLARVHHPDFNGWWCFAFPIEAMAAAGLPMPCFIRGDDVEYGYRLKRAGWPTLGWPGLAVWHMPFDAKAAAWHSFYDRRNALFANALHRRIGRGAALGKLIGGFVLHLLRYDYARVEAMTRGIEAFNRGAPAMERWTHHEHAALLASVMPEPVPVAMHALAAQEGVFTFIAPPPLGAGKRSARMAARFMADVLWPWRRTRPVLLAPGLPWRGDLVQRPAHVLETDAAGHPVAIYRYRWWLSCVATGRCLIALLSRLLIRISISCRLAETCFSPRS